MGERTGRRPHQRLWLGLAGRWSLTRKTMTRCTSTPRLTETTACPKALTAEEPGPPPPLMDIRYFHPTLWRSIRGTQTRSMHPVSDYSKARMEPRVGALFIRRRLLRPLS